MKDQLKLIKETETAQTNRVKSSACLVAAEQYVPTFSGGKKDFRFYRSPIDSARNIDIAPMSSVASTHNKAPSLASMPPLASPGPGDVFVEMLNQVPRRARTNEEQGHGMADVYADSFCRRTGTSTGTVSRAAFTTTTVSRTSVNGSLREERRREKLVSHWR